MVNGEWAMDFFEEMTDQRISGFADQRIFSWGGLIREFVNTQIRKFLPGFPDHRLNAITEGGTVGDENGRWRQQFYRKCMRFMPNMNLCKDICAGSQIGG